MKTQKFKIERKILQELDISLRSLATRLRIATGFLVENNHNDFHSFGVLNIYYNLVLTYLSEIEQLLSLGGNSVIVSKELMEKLNNYKKAINKTEVEASSIPFLSLSIH